MGSFEDTKENDQSCVSKTTKQSGIAFHRDDPCAAEDCVKSSVQTTGSFLFGVCCAHLFLGMYTQTVAKLAVSFGDLVGSFISVRLIVLQSTHSHIFKSNQN